VQWHEADRAELLGTAEEATDRLTAIVDDLLDMTRLESGGIPLSLEDVAVEDVLSRAVARAGGVAVTVPGDLPAVRVDVALTDRVLANLVANAMRHAAGLPVEIVARATDHAVEVRVVDHGHGVPDDLKERMFAPFERLGVSARGEGVGLGLTVAQGLAQAQDARVRAEDTPGGGLTMVLTLPVASSREPR
jgi:two-component system sensor histidine kinase KdpD